MSLTLIQPRHNYAPDEGLGHVHLSAPLPSVKARLQIAGIRDIQLLDANITPINYENLSWIVGFNLVGAPYIPEVLYVIEHTTRDVEILLWGQIIGSLSDEEFMRIFHKTGRKNIHNGNNLHTLGKTLGIDPMTIPPVECIDMTSVYTDIDDEYMRLYLEREFSVYVSQGCKYNCNFCQAAKGRPEIYRELSGFENELRHLVSRAKSFWLNEISFYMSNLDILQTPEEFAKFLDVIERIRGEKPGFEIRFRWLCGIESFMNCYFNHHDMLVRARRLWLHSIGYGIDGATPEVWKSIWKSQNFRKISWGEQWSDQEKAIKTIEWTKGLGIRPEILMVFWHQDETPESLKLAYTFCAEMQEKYGALPRPHVSKTIIPWAKAWKESVNHDLVERFITEPWLFQALDYTALASEVTHRDKRLRRETNTWYQKICALDPKATKYVIPDTPHYRAIAERKNTTVAKMNEGKFDR
jgi:2-iminoacetate synthase ThiH